MHFGIKDLLIFFSSGRFVGALRTTYQERKLRRFDSGAWNLKRSRGRMDKKKITFFTTILVGIVCLISLCTSIAGWVKDAKEKDNTTDEPTTAIVQVVEG